MFLSSCRHVQQELHVSLYQCKRVDAADSLTLSDTILSTAVSLVPACLSLPFTVCAIAVQMMAEKQKQEGKPQTQGQKGHPRVAL